MYFSKWSATILLTKPDIEASGAITQIKQASAKLIKMTEESTLWIIKI